MQIQFISINDNTLFDRVPATLLANDGNNNTIILIDCTVRPTQKQTSIHQNKICV